MKFITIQGKTNIGLNEIIYLLFLLFSFLVFLSSIIALIISAMRYAKRAAYSKKFLLFSIVGFIVGLLVLVFLIKGPIIIIPSVPFHDGPPVLRYGG